MYHPLYQQHDGLPPIQLAPEIVTWPAVEQALRVIKGLTNSTVALRDWLYTFSNTFEPVWDDITFTVRHQIYGHLRALPTTIAKRRQSVIDADRERDGDDYQPRASTGIQRDDLPSIEDYKSLVRCNQVDPWVSLRQEGDALSAFRPQTRAQVSSQQITQGRLLAELQFVASTFPNKHKAKRSYKEEAEQDWLPSILEGRIFRDWSQISPEGQGRVWSYLQGIPTQMELARKRKTTIKPSRFLLSSDRLWTLALEETSQPQHEAQSTHLNLPFDQNLVHEGPNHLAAEASRDQQFFNHSQYHSANFSNARLPQAYPHQAPAGMSAYPVDPSLIYGGSASSSRPFSQNQHF